MSDINAQADNVTPPISSATPGVGVTCFTASTTASSIDLYDANGNPYAGLYNRYLYIVSISADCYFLFSESTVTIDESVGHASSITSATTTAVPWLLKDGVAQPIRLTGTSLRYLNLKAASGTPKVRLYPSSHGKV
jgi:hypothetical protein